VNTFHLYKKPPPIIDMPIGTPVGNLDIANATLRTSNLETQNIKIGSIFVGTGNSLEETANVGNSMSNTIQFTNTHTAFTTTGNVTVGKELTVTGSATFSGDVTVDTTTFHVDTTNNRVGVGTVSPGAALDVDGTVKATTFEGGGSALTALNATNIASGTLDVARVPNLVNLVYPIGAVYISVNSADPGTIWAGTTWVAFGAGRTLVGLNSGDSDFDLAEETGGAKTHTLTRSQIPPHQHNIQEFPGYSENASQWLSFTTGQYNGLPFRRGGANANYRKPSGDGTDIPNPIGNGSGAAASHNIMQPYIVTYMWKRTA